jgi:hypothetical protein
MSLAKQGDGYYRIKLLVKTDSDWTIIKPLPPWDNNWHIAETKIIKPKRDQDQIIIRKLNIKAPSYNDLMKEIEFIVYFKAQDEDLEFEVTKGDLGSTIVQAFNICSENEYRIGKYTNSNVDGSGKNPAKFRMSIKKINKYGTVEYKP